MWAKVCLPFRFSIALYPFCHLLVLKFGTFFYFTIIFTLQILLPSNCSTFHIPPSLHEDVPTLQPTRPLNVLGHPVSWGLGASSLTELTTGSPLLYMYWGGGTHFSWCRLPGWWSSVWEILELQVNWNCWFSYKVAILLSFLQFFPNSIESSAASVHWLGAHIYIWLFSCLLDLWEGSYDRSLFESTP